MSLGLTTANRRNHAFQWFRAARHDEVILLNVWYQAEYIYESYLDSFSRAPAKL